MVPLGGDHQNADDHTQLFDSQCSPPLSLSGNGFGQFTVPFDDYVNVPGEDVDETQVLTLAGETQVFDHVPEEDVSETQVLTQAGETQVFDVGGETQVLDDGDFMGTTNTQVLVKFDDVIASDRDGYDTDGIEVIYDTDQLSDGGQSVEGCQLLGEANIGRTLPCNQGNGETSSDCNTCLASENKISEHSPRFTSVRVASLRASGLAARGFSANRTESESASFLVKRQLSDGNWVHDLETDDWKLKGLDNLDNSRNRSPTARRLCYDDISPTHEGVSQDMENFDESECLAGLSYVDSQEPGELSQANALNFIEGFINDNLAECNTETEHGMSAGTKSKSVSSAKGLQSLARKTAEGDTVGRTGIFDWDDNHEDDGGGEFFCRKKEDLLVKGGQTRKSSIKVQGPERKRGEHMGMYKQSDDSGKRVVDAASRLMLQKSEDESKSFEEIHHLPDFTKEINKEASAEHLQATARMTNALEFSDVGFDTQMAAEAMEVLSFGLDVLNDDTNDVQEADRVDPGFFAKASQRGKNGYSRGPSSKVGVHDPEFHLSAGRLGKAKKIGTKSSRGSSVMLPSGSVDVEECGLGVEDRKMKGTGRDATENPYCTNIQLSRGSKPRVLSTKGKLENIRSSHNDDSFMKFTTRRFAKRKRSCLKQSDNVSKYDNLGEPSGSANDAQEAVNLLKKSRSNSRRKRSDLSMRKSSACTKFFSLINGNVEGTGMFPHRRTENQHARVGATCCNGESTKGNLIYSTSIGAENHTEGSQVFTSVIGESVAANGNTDNSAKQTPEQSPLLCTTPVSCVISPKPVSSSFTKDEYFKRSCRKNLSGSFLARELFTLSPMEQESISPSKDTRKRRNLTEVRVLLSQHLDDDIIRQQQKIMVRLGISEVSTIADATHFVADNFMRTRNLLEAIASGKLVVTHLWLESVGQVNIHIDEEPYILRDIQKEKEFGFSMPVSLVRAQKCSLLQGRNVLITPNVKPSKDTISCLVKTVHGQAVERTDRSALKDDMILNDLLILSCEEDYAVCVPLLEKGASAYSSELLLNGIVAQKLEYQRYRLFTDHAKRRCSGSRKKFC